MTARARLVALARRLPYPVRHAGRQVMRSERARRLARPVRWGSLRRTRPVSRDYGLDRGTPVDRVFLDRFFAEHAGDIRGAVLEVGGPVFSGRFGGGITSTDIVDIDPGNGLATIVVDLATPGVLPPEAFDCAIVPQTLQYVADPRAAVVNLIDALRPGGVLLVTVPVIAQLDRHAAAVDRWRVTPVGFAESLARWCPDAEVTVGSAGNVLVATAFLQGVAAEELRPTDFDVVDPLYPIIATARVVRPDVS
ncbi:MAG: methyltransferase domain-containing protein [Actinomycetes bacterium]